ncbi:MAG: hypothetical protein FWG44_02530 [Oscillospiraceae bacterium]|nr:hypothetical protein [Oscillospiraceae bacterium]
MTKSFLKQLSNLSENITPETAETDKIYALVHNQTDGFKSPKAKDRKVLRSPVILIAIISALILGGTATAYYYSRGASEIFNDVLKESASDGEAIPLSPDSPLAEIVDKSGIVLEESVIVEGVEVTLKGVVGAGSELKILIDIEDLSGKPLALLNDDGSLSENPLDFKIAKIRTNETLDYVNYLTEVPEITARGSFGDVVLTLPNEDISEDGWVRNPWHNLWSEIIKSDAPNKAAMLLNLSLDGESIEDFMGENMYLTITDIVQSVLKDGFDTGADLYSIVNEFNNVTDADFRRSGGSTQDFVNWEFSYELITDSGKEIPLSESFEDYTVTNAAVKDGVLYLRGELKNYDSVGIGYMQAQLFTLLNTKTGEYLRGTVGYGDGDADHVPRWRGSFEGINSIEELKDYVLIFDFGWRNQTVAEGQWSFEIPLSFENLATTYNIGQKFMLGGFELTANSVTVSPYYISLDATADNENLAKMNHIQNPITSDWNPIVSGLTDLDRFLIDEQPMFTVVMKDGSEIEMKISPHTSFYSSVSFSPEVVIDPAQIEAVKIGDLYFNVK